MKDEKLIYEEAQMEVIRFDTEDVITTSGFDGLNDDFSE